MDYRELCLKTTEIVKEASNFIRKEFERFDLADIRFKDKNDLVSYVDIESEKLLMKLLKELLPESEFIAEESSHPDHTDKDKCYWIIDPLDGTTNFVHKVPVFSVSVALMVGNSIKLGVVEEVVREECFYAWENGPAYLNGKEIRVSGTRNLENSLIATGFPFRDFEMIDYYTEILKYMMKHTRGVRRLGSAAADLVYVACGRFDAFYEYGLSSWDVAGGAFIVQQAGGKVSDFRGIDNYVFGKQIVASSSGVYEEMLQVLAKFRG
jgi:myo-inositol-1(or 4)-monophosphatase